MGIRLGVLVLSLLVVAPIRAQVFEPTRQVGATCSSCGGCDGTSPLLGLGAHRDSAFLSNHGDSQDGVTTLHRSVPDIAVAGEPSARAWR